MATVVPDSVGSATVEPTDSKLVQEKGAAAATHATHELCAEVFELQVRDSMGRWNPIDARPFASDPAGNDRLACNTLTSSSIALPAPWRWSTPSWQVAVGPSTTKEGWAHAAAFTRDVSTYTKSIVDRYNRSYTCRVRRWYRHVLVEAGVEVIDEASEEPLPVHLHTVHHLVLLVHGTGPHDAAKMRRKVNKCGALLDQLREGGYDTSTCSVAFDYVSWNDGVTHVTKDVAEDLESVKLESIPAIRNIIHSNFADVFSYMGDYSNDMLNHVASRANERYQQFCLTHPFYKPGPATVLAHSLGSVIMFDILTASTNAITFPVAQLISVGSPLGLFVAIRRGKAAEYARLHERLRQRGGRLVNIFHRVDPIASRVGPLLQGTHAAAPIVKLPEYREKGALSGYKTTLSSWQQRYSKVQAQSVQTTTVSAAATVTATAVATEEPPSAGSSDSTASATVATPVSAAATPPEPPASTRRAPPPVPPRRTFAAAEPGHDATLQQLAAAAEMMAGATNSTGSTVAAAAAAGAARTTVSSGGGAGGGAGAGAGEHHAGGVDTLAAVGSSSSSSAGAQVPVALGGAMDFELQHRTRSLRDLNEYLAATKGHTRYWREPDFMAFVLRCAVDVAHMHG